MNTNKLYLSLPDAPEVHDRPLKFLLGKGDAWTTDTEQALRFAKDGVRVVRRDRHIVTGEVCETELSAEDLASSLKFKIEMRGQVDLNRPMRHIVEDGSLTELDIPVVNDLPDGAFDACRKDKERWAVSEDGEMYFGDYDSRAAAIAAGAEMCDSHTTFHVGRCEDPTPPENLWCAVDWLESVGYNEDYASEAAEGWDRGIDREQLHALEARVSKVLGAWLDENFLRPAFFKIVDAEEIATEKLPQPSSFKVDRFRQALEEIRDLVGGESDDTDRDLTRMQTIASFALSGEVDNNENDNE